MREEQMDVCKLSSTNELVDHTEMVASRLYYRAHIYSLSLWKDYYVHLKLRCDHMICPLP